MHEKNIKQNNAFPRVLVATSKEKANVHSCIRDTISKSPFELSGNFDISSLGQVDLISGKPKVRCITTVSQFAKL